MRLRAKPAAHEVARCRPCNTCQHRMSMRRCHRRSAIVAAQRRPFSTAVPGTAAAASAGVLAALLAADPALAVSLHQEPSNALSLPTWAIHISSVVEWCAQGDALVSHALARLAAICTTRIDAAQLSSCHECVCSKDQHTFHRHGTSDCLQPLAHVRCTWSTALRFVAYLTKYKQQRCVQGHWHLAHVDLCRGERAAILESNVVGHGAIARQRHVRMHLALVLQRP